MERMKQIFQFSTWAKVATRITLVCLIISSAPAQAQTQIDIATAYPAGNFHVLNLQTFAKEVTNATNGKLVVQVHPGGSLVKAQDIRKAVTEGKVTAGEVFGPSMSGVNMVFGLDALPFLATNYPSALKLWKVTEKSVDAKLAAEGLTLLMSVPWPPQGLFTKKPLVSAKDMDGLNMRENSPPIKRFAELIGTKPVNIETPELASAAKAGKFDLVFTSAAQGMDTKLAESLPYFYQANAWLPRNLVFINSKVFNTLPRDQQLTLIKLAGKAEERGWSMSEKFAQTTATELGKSGAKVSPLPASIQNKLQRSGNQLASDLLRKSDPALMSVLSDFFMQ